MEYETSIVIYIEPLLGLPNTIINISHKLENGHLGAKNNIVE